MAIHYTGVVRCEAQGTATVELTADEREALLLGRLPCPCCGTACQPTFRLEEPTASASMSWRRGRWDSIPTIGER